VFWLRKEFEAREVDASKPAALWIDSLDRQIASIYINGKEISTLGKSAPRYYQSGLFSVPVPVGIVKPGRNVLAIRCTTFTPDTLKGFSGPNLRLPVAEPKKISDEWLMKAETVFPVPSEEAIATLPVFTLADVLHAPAALYNAMIHPLQPYTLQGAVWYQGESNIKKADRYKALLGGLIGAWRTHWAQGDFPFYIVQLANYHGVPEQPAATDKPNVHDQLARLREAQMQTTEHVAQSGLAVAIDIGEESIHPANKQDVGDRLARLALAKTYGRKEVSWQSPRYDSIQREGSSLRVKFKDCPEGLMVAAKDGLEPARETPDAKLQHFAVAGADHKFVWAEARIEGSSVVVSSAAVPEPVAVRYAWAENPKGCNLYGKNGLPAAPFRSDSLPAPVDPRATAR
jgi:sialate O-acetylesterase